MASFWSWNQDWAIIRRYLVIMLRYPVRSGLRVLIWPGLLVALSWYIISSDIGDGSPDMMKGISAAAPSIIMFTTVMNVYSFSNSLISDKATGMKSLMISMGLSRFHYYRAMSLCFLASVLPVALAMAIILRAYLLTEVNYLSILLVFALFTLHLDAIVAAFVSFVISTNYSFIILLLVLFEGALSRLADWTSSHTSEAWKPLILFAASFSPYEAIRLFLAQFITSIGLQQPTDLVILSQVFWILLLRLFAYWFEEVCPWQTVSEIRHPCFCFGAGRKSKRDTEDAPDTQSIHSRFFESIQQHREVGIKISHATKTFSNVPAVNDISFSIFKGETTLLLGHNGAGKSTLMNMILGLTEPDKGSVKILAQSSKSPSIGVCPQTSVLDDDLTVEQHLILFNDIKSNISGHERTAHVRQTIGDVSLSGQESKLPQELSGGMKRKLSLGIAFIGKSEVLILDEPSSGLDPDSRMFVWNAIRRYRSDRTVLLSTQHMEEADYLGDRIAIMSAGHIVCCGSSVFLNRVLGTGYKIRIECKLSRKKSIIDHIKNLYFDAALPSESGVDSPRDARSDPIIDFVLELNKSSHNDKDSELDLIRLLEDFENNSKSLGLRSYGLKSSSIEDVMLNTGKSLADNSRQTTRLEMTSVSGHIAAITDKNVIYKTANSTLLYALIMKHVQVSKANWFTVLLLRVAFPVTGCWLLGKRIGDSRGALGAEYYFQITELGILISHLIYFPVREKASKFKTVQLDSKATVWLYWLSQMVFDLLGLALCVVFVNVFTSIYVETILVSGFQVYGLLTLATALFYLATMAFCYCLSTLLGDPNSSIGYLWILIVLSSALYLVVRLVRLVWLGERNFTWLQVGLNYLFVLLSPFDAYAFFIMGLQGKCYIFERDRKCTEISGVSPVAFGLLALCLQVIGYVGLLTTIERQMVNLEWYFNWRNIIAIFKKPPRFAGDHREIDRDVVEETTKALTAINNPQVDQALVVARLNKSYVRNTKIIEDLAFTVGRGECFGLLGVNGAGKTTTFSMIAAETCPDSGRILAKGNYHDQDLHRYREVFGYDPQATPELSLTPYQALNLMAKLRGVNDHNIPVMIKSILELLEMTEHTHKPDKKLSGGTKRKLALGMALIGNPAILTLDEPTAGVDPLARRGVWQLLKSLRTLNDVSIVISSHAMEECEAICDRIAIMARGKLRCIGTFLHLRSKFAKGCTLRVQFSKSMSMSPQGAKVTPHSPNNNQQGGGQSLVAHYSQTSTVAQVLPNGGGRRASTSSQQATDPIVEELQQQLNSTIGPSVFKLADRNVNSVTFDVTDNRVRRSILFRMMRDFRQKHPGVSYMINDSSLEEIFISLAREQQTIEQQWTQQP